jgi:thiol-disulfide isomerase/thioredoxin
MARNIWNLTMGLVASIGAMAAIFYFFLFLNPLGIHEVTLLKWIPIAACALALLASGAINRKTPAMYLPLLFLPFAIFDLFNFLYFPFAVVLVIVGLFALALPRPGIPRSYKTSVAVALVGIFAFFLLKQPLILEHEGFGRNAAGELVGATVVWDFTDSTQPTLPDHTLVTADGTPFNTATLKGQTHFVSFWATWCAPCIEEQPELEQLKRDFQAHDGVDFVDISIDENRERWATFVEEQSLTGTQLITTDPDATRRALRIGALPLHYVVDAQGAYSAFNSLHDAERMLRATAAP